MELDNEELRILIASGRDTGYLTIDSVSEAVSELNASHEQVKELHGHLTELGIELISKEDASSRVAGAAEEPEEVVAPVAVTHDAGTEATLDRAEAFERRSFSSSAASGSSPSPRSGGWRSRTVRSRRGRTC